MMTVPADCRCGDEGNGATEREKCPQKLKRNIAGKIGSNMLLSELQTAERASTIVVKW